MNQFQYPLFGCYDNLTLCLISYFFPCYTLGKTAEAVGEDCCLCGLAYVFAYSAIGAIIRGKVREQKDIPGSFAKDFTVHCCCPVCAVIQDNQEVGGTATAAQSISRV